MSRSNAAALLKGGQGEILYYLRRAKTEIRQAQQATKREVSLVHFQLADAYLQLIHDLMDAARGHDGGRLIAEEQA